MSTFAPIARSGAFLTASKATSWESTLWSAYSGTLTRSPQVWQLVERLRTECVAGADDYALFLLVSRYAGHGLAVVVVLPVPLAPATTMPRRVTPVRS